MNLQGLDQRIAHGDPGEVAEELDRLIRVVQDAADRRDVCFLASDIAADGAKIILTSGAPRSTGHDEESMLLALRAIVDSAPAIPVRIGVNSGPVFTGEIGTSDWRTYTAMGDPVNVAARIMGKARAGEIVAALPVIDRSRTLFTTERIDPFTVKGKRQPLVAGTLGPARGTRTEVAADDLPMIGRDAELEVLAEAAVAARAHGGTAVEIVAEPGTGKSRLVNEFIARCPDFTVQRAECRLYQADTPYFPIAQLLSSALGLSGLTSSAKVRRLHALVSSACPQLTPWLSLIGIALQLRIEPSEDVRLLDNEFRKSRLEAAVTELLGAVMDTPTILYVEDAHWIDDASADLLGALAADITSRPCILIITRRGNGPDLNLDQPTHRRIELAPIDSGFAIGLVEMATRDAPLPQHVVATLSQRSGGNPLFILELVNAIRAGGDLDSLPTSVEALITARIDRLPAHERSLLRRASVLGVGFHSAHLSAVVTDDNPLDAVSQLHDFLSVDETGWVSFRHALVRTVAYEGLPYRTRRQLHSQVADSIMSTAESVPGEHLAMLSPHLFYAQRDVEAWQCSIEAGDRARDVYANLDAAALYERALTAAARIGGIDDLARSSVHETLGDVLELAGLYNDASRAYAAARRLAGDDPPRHGALLLKAAYVAEHQGRYTNSIRLLRKALRLIEVSSGSDGRELRAELIAWEAAVRALQGRFDDALRHARNSVDEALAAGKELIAARAYLIVDFAEMSLGRSESVENSNLALEIYTRLGDLQGVATAANNLGGYHYYGGRWDTAADLYRQSRAARQRLGDPVSAAYCDFNLAEILVEQGDHQQAETSLLSALTTMRSVGDQWGTAFATRLLGVVKLRTAALDDAAELLRSAMTIFNSIGAKAEAFDTKVSIAECLLFDDRADEALALVETLVAEAEATGEHEPQLPAMLRWRGYAIGQLGDLDAGAAEVRGALRAARRLGAIHEVGLALGALDHFNAATGRVTPEADISERDDIIGRLRLQPRPAPPGWPGGAVSGT